MEDKSNPNIGEPDMPLSPELVIPSIDNLNYRIGLSFYSISERPVRLIINNPFIVFGILTIFLIKLLVPMLLGDEYERVFKVLSDLGYLVGIRQQFDLFLVILTLITMCSQLLYYYNFRKKINPTFLRVFQMMSGSRVITPKSLGLTDQEQIKRLLKITKRMYYAIFINNIVFPLFAFIMNLILSCADSSSYLEGLIYGVPNGILVAFFCVYFANIVFHQCFEFFIICLYLKIRIRELNQRLLGLNSREFRDIRKTLGSYDSLIAEIDEYNTTFWSKFLLLFWFGIGFDITLLLYVIIYLPLNLVVLLIAIYGLVVYCIIYFLIIFTASSVNCCAFETYKILNTVFISYSQKFCFENIVLSQNNGHKYYTRTRTVKKVL